MAKSFDLILNHSISVSWTIQLYNYKKGPHQALAQSYHPDTVTPSSQAQIIISHDLLPIVVLILIAKLLLILTI